MRPFRTRRGLSHAAPRDGISLDPLRLLLENPSDPDNDTMPELEPLLRYSAAAALGAGVALLVSSRQRASSTPAPPVAAPCKPTYNDDTGGQLSEVACNLSGTMLLCTQNLAVSGANQVLLNLVEGRCWKGNLVVLSPSNGPFAKEFADLGAAVRIGDLDTLLQQVRDVRVAICNTIMTAHNVLGLDAVGIPSMWILHEWWPGKMLSEELEKRNDKNTTPAIVKRALDVCRRTVCVCNNQLALYRPTNGQAIFVGVPEPEANWKIGAPPPSSRPITFLTLGIVCPRKNQHHAVETFLKWAGDRKDVRLLVVGARYIRQYEIDYVDKVKASIGGDPRVELIDVTSDVDAYYRQADVLLFTSLNEVTPMVIAEAMMRSIPVITTDIAGIPEMLTNGVHGYSLSPDDSKGFHDALTDLGTAGADGQRRRLQMAAAARKHALASFTNAGMVQQYRACALELASPIVLLDMDGVVVDWDAGFTKAWANRSPIDRTKSYAMEECVPAAHRAAAIELFHSKGFFRGLPPMAGSLSAVKAMAAKGYRVFFCTSPVLTSENCAGEKYEWIRAHLGNEWVSRVIVTSDKTAVRGDVLIDDKPKIVGMHLPTWRHLMFAAPYNQAAAGVAPVAPAGRLASWDGWEEALSNVLRGEPKLAPGGSSSTSLDASADGVGGSAAAAGGAGSELKQAVALLPDFAHLLPPDYRKDYAAWRTGGSKGAKGELEEVMDTFDAMQDAVMNNTSEDFTEIHVYRRSYASWRRGKAKGAKGSVVEITKQNSSFL